MISFLNDSLKLMNHFLGTVNNERFELETNSDRKMQIRILKTFIDLFWLMFNCMMALWYFNYGFKYILSSKISHQLDQKAKKYVPH